MSGSAAYNASAWKRDLWPVVGSPDGTSDGEVFATPVKRQGMIPVSLSEPSSAALLTPTRPPAASGGWVPDSLSSIPDPLDAYSVSQAKSAQRLRVRKPRKGHPTPRVAARSGPIVGIRSIIQTMSKKIVGWRGVVEEKFGIKVGDKPQIVGTVRTHSNIVGATKIHVKANNKFVGGFKRWG